MGEVPVGHLLGRALVQILQHLDLLVEQQPVEQIQPESVQSGVEEGHFDPLAHVVVDGNFPADELDLLLEQAERVAHPEHSLGHGSEFPPVELVPDLLVYAEEDADVLQPRQASRELLALEDVGGHDLRRAVEDGKEGHQSLVVVRECN